MLCLSRFKRLGSAFTKHKLNLSYFATQYDDQTAKKCMNLYEATSPLHWYMKPAEDHVISYVLNIENKESKSVLDIACGIGAYCESCWN